MRLSRFTPARKAGGHDQACSRSMLVGSARMMYSQERTRVVSSSVVCSTVRGCFGSVTCILCGRT